MLSLSIDTALQRCTVVIARDLEPISIQLLGMEKGHAEHLAPMAASALKEAGLAVRDLDRVGVTVGPGGFTGVRVGLAFARGLVLGVKAHAVGVSTLRALAAGAQSDSECVAPVIDARRGEVYAALYDRCGAEIVAPFVADPETAGQKLKSVAPQALLCGSGAEIIGAIVSNWPREDAAAQIEPHALVSVVARAPRTLIPPAPLYLRAPDAKPPTAKPIG